jgi:hypothetical protein
MAKSMMKVKSINKMINNLVGNCIYESSKGKFQIVASSFKPKWNLLRVSSEYEVYDCGSIKA